MIGQRLKEWRKTHNITRKEMAKTAGIAPATIQNFEDYGKNPTLDTIIKIKLAYNLDLNWLISGEPDADGEAVNPSDKLILDIYHSFNEDQKDKVLILMKMVKDLTLQK